MLSFSPVAEALMGLIYHRPSGEISNFYAFAQAFRQHVVDSQKSYASILHQNSAAPQPQDKAFTFSAEQLIKFVGNVAIQVAQPQVCCYANPNQDARLSGFAT